ncbi:MAG: imidazoleglycerol-phosphate dehydratase [Candidatus Methanoplasma sp.]|jgi:imidazoleglycerol-phosphate dehydratase|nr:imidazoleglycerol-phosphate dehydratase [Candidatus Methanoplasma sp.]
MTSRTSLLERDTRETKVSVKLNIDGNGKFDVSTDVPFLTHMVETLARYASFDIELTASGDNEHHIVEDVAITLGIAFKNAIGDNPVERTATATIPMDDALVTVSLDIIDRPFADIDSPDRLYQHFFRSFAMSAGLTLHIVKLRGFDDHHVTEASFKALGKALKQASVPRKTELSTKDKAKVS